MHIFIHSWNLSTLLLNKIDNFLLSRTKWIGSYSHANLIINIDGWWDNVSWCNNSFLNDVLLKWLHFCFVPLLQYHSRHSTILTMLVVITMIKSNTWLNDQKNVASLSQFFIDEAFNMIAAYTKLHWRINHVFEGATLLQITAHPCKSAPQFYFNLTKLIFALVSS